MVSNALCAPQQLDSICKSLPTDEERKTLAAYTGDVSDLSHAEQLLMGLMHIPLLGDKLAAAKLLGSFHSRLAGVQAAADTLRGACQVRRNGFRGWGIAVAGLGDGGVSRER